MSGKTNKTINSVYGVMVPASPITQNGCTVLSVATTATVSGHLFGNAIYRIECDEDVSLAIGQTNTQFDNPVCLHTHPTFYANTPEMLSTDASLTGTDGAESYGIVIVASGHDTGTLHATKMKTRGE